MGVALVEYHSPVYELLHKCEKIGMRSPRAWDLMPEDAILEVCKAFLGGNHGRDK